MIEAQGAAHTCRPKERLPGKRTPGEVGAAPERCFDESCIPGELGIDKPHRSAECGAREPYLLKVAILPGDCPGHAHLPGRKHRVDERASMKLHVRRDGRVDLAEVQAAADDAVAEPDVVACPQRMRHFIRWHSALRHPAAFEQFLPYWRFLGPSVEQPQCTNHERGSTSKRRAVDQHAVRPPLCATVHLERGRERRAIRTPCHRDATLRPRHTEPMASAWRACQLIAA